MSSTSTPASIEDRICDAIASFGPERSKVVREASLESLDVDSLDMVELAQIVEEDLGIHIHTADFEGVETVGQAIDVVVAKAAQVAQA